MPNEYKARVELFLDSRYHGYRLLAVHLHRQYLIGRLIDAAEMSEHKLATGH